MLNQKQILSGKMAHYKMHYTVNVIVMSSLCYPNYTIFGMLFCLNGLVIHYIWVLQGWEKGSEAQISCNKDIFVLGYLLNMWWNDMLSSLSYELSGFRFVHVIRRMMSTNETTMDKSHNVLLKSETNLNSQITILAYYLEYIASPSWVWHCHI